MICFASLLGLFGAFDENLDNHIDFKEMACGISACCRGPMVEKHKCKSHLIDVTHAQETFTGNLHRIERCCIRC